MFTLLTLDCCFFFFFNDTATTEIYTLSLHDALPIWRDHPRLANSADFVGAHVLPYWENFTDKQAVDQRSEEHTSELQSQSNLVCRLLLEKKKKKEINDIGSDGMDKENARFRNTANL